MAVAIADMGIFCVRFELRGPFWLPMSHKSVKSHHRDSDILEPTVESSPRTEHHGSTVPPATEDAADVEPFEVEVSTMSGTGRQNSRYGSNIFGFGLPLVSNDWFS